MYSNLETPEGYRSTNKALVLPNAGQAAPSTVPVASLLPGDSPRLAGENAEHVRLLAAVQDLPPIIVHRRTMRIIDGMHRLRAAQLRGDDSISVIFFEGDEGEAFLLSVDANIKHGLPLSLADREAAARRILGLYRQWSNRAVAVATGLSPTTVGAIRNRLFPPDEQESRVGRDGRVRPVDRAAGRQRVSAVIAVKPDAPLRAIAKEAGVSVGTARDVRERLRAGRDPGLVPQRGSAAERETAADGTAEPRRADTARRNVDWPSVRGHLVKDPAVKYAENGRAFIRWADGHVVERAEWDSLIEAVPPHWRTSVAELARSCAGAWLAFAQALEDRS
jgi:ParB-like chromosome segregation protein Spo0J